MEKSKSQYNVHLTRKIHPVFINSQRTIKKYQMFFVIYFVCYWFSWHPVYWPDILSDPCEWQLMERSKQVLISHCYWIRERLGEKDAKSFSANIDIFQTMLQKKCSPRRGFGVMTIFVIFGTLVFLFFCRENRVILNW